MENRGQKRTDTSEELPADKRACNSVEFRPSTSVSPVRTPMNEVHEAHDADMDTSSSTSGSMRSEGDMERDSSGSCDSDNNYRDYYRRRSSGDQSKFKKVMSSLTESVDESEQLAALNELCELLSFCSDSSLSGLMADSFSPLLVKLARHESNPDIMLLAIRAITYFCDVHPRASAYLVRHDAVPALCQRLSAIEYLDVAEQCLQALEKISQEHPLACLQSGAILAVLNYIDFFSTVLQRVALSTVVNICKKLPSESPSPFMDAVPILCNLLQYEDRQLVESVATCLIKITEQVGNRSDMLDALCKHGLVQQAVDLINLNSRTSLCQQIYLGLIQVLVKLASGSVLAVRTLFEINISRILKDILSSFDISHGITSSTTVDGQCNQVHEVLKLLNELLPATTTAGEQDSLITSEKVAFFTSRPDLLQSFGLDLLPVLIQVVNSGVNLYVCYGCLSVISKFVYFSKSDLLLEVLECTNISSFLAGVFTRKDFHVLLLSLQIVETVLQKLSHAFLSSFVKEGVFSAVDSFLSTERCSHSMFHTSNGLQEVASQKSASRDGGKCLCFAFDTGQSPTTSDPLVCKIDEDSIKKLAEHIKGSYFSAETMNLEKGLTAIFHKLKTLASRLAHMVSVEMVNSSSSDEREEELYLILRDIVSVLNGEDPISTFEFLESGIVRSLLMYLSNGQYMDGKEGAVRGKNHLCVIEKRFKAFGNLLFSFSKPTSLECPLPALIKKLQSSLAFVETFPVILSQKVKLKSSHAKIPYGRATSYPCLKVQFQKVEEELSLGEYVADVVTVDPFSTLDRIEKYMWSKVSTQKAGAKSAQSDGEGSCSSQSRTEDSMESDCMSNQVNEMQLEDNMEQVPEKGPTKITGCQRCDKDEESSPKLVFYLDGEELELGLTLYQAIIQRKFKEENDGSTSSSNLWSRVYKVTYGKAVEQINCQDHDCCSLGNATDSSRYPLLFSDIFASELTDMNGCTPAYDILSLLKCLEGINRFRFHLTAHDRMFGFVKGAIDDFDNYNLEVNGVPQSEFVNSKLTEKLEQQMRDPLAVSIGGLPAWCSQLMGSYPFLFGYDARCKYFWLAMLGQQASQSRLSRSDEVGVMHPRRQNSGNYSRKKFLVDRSKVLDSAIQMMNVHAQQKVVLEVEYHEEVGTGLGPTLEFYTLISHEFQKSGLCMWRGDHEAQRGIKDLERDESGVLAPLGLFPRPWSPRVDISVGSGFPNVMEKFVLLGQIVGKALQDGRVLDLPFSKAFYKLVLGKELTMYDIQLFDHELGRALLEFQALVEKKKYLESMNGESSSRLDLRYHRTRIEDLCLEFTLPGYPDYFAEPASGSKMVNMSNLEEFVSFVVDATIKTGISRQVEAFKSGFCQVLPIQHLRLFSEEELERLLCGEHSHWDANELLDHIKFDHGYTASSAPIINFLQIIQEFDIGQQRSFLRFVTGAPRLPSGGLASLNPKLTVVRKHCTGKWVDSDLPSVMTCANYLKLPPYSSKELMREKLLYAITEGQGSFHLS
ncbi:OLC1v1034662C1 [Oldenlandia corymbosa var. corymbosa]|uniref:HECT-type E3 ubiquitin transferase n=1 Tax=Oldenlandia corymbosa var. corymbosa TaxID=529605 RepID=A0AAV1CU26_OLDCO|nr:OLC1v1034662C1 [Oldenlandia corymbosa var. corymbosa]